MPGSACRAQTVIARAVEQKTIFDGEVADGEKRLQELLEEEVNAPVPVPAPRVAELQQQIDDLVRERELLRASQTRIPREQPTMRQGGPTNPPWTMRRVDQLTKLRSQECPRIRRRSYNQSDRKSVKSGHHTHCASKNRDRDVPNRAPSS